VQPLHTQLLATAERQVQRDSMSEISYASLLLNYQRSINVSYNVNPRRWSFGLANDYDVKRSLFVVVFPVGVTNRKREMDLMFFKRAHNLQIDLLRKDFELP
jgi:hypothetical protein